MSSTWTNIFKTGNDTDQDYLNLFRQFHCADCLKSFQKQQTDKQISDYLPKNSELPIKKPSSHQSLKSTVNNKKQTKKERLQMNTPPPPLLPITDEARNGLYHYFGQQNQQYQATSCQQQQQATNGFININNNQLNNGLSQNVLSELKLMPNLTQIGSNLQNSMQQKINITLPDANASGFSFIPTNVDIMNDHAQNFNMDTSSIQEKSQSN